MKKKMLWVLGAVVLALVVVVAVHLKNKPWSPLNVIHPGRIYRWVALRELRTKHLAAIRPVRLSNCVMKRFGDRNDGGYVLCENLTGQAQSAYSYGIDGRDQWGCDVSRAYHLPIHQYDCFNPKRPTCKGEGAFQFHFHDECVGAGPARIDDRPFDSMTNQIAKNGDAGKHLLVKMDVETSEWDSFAATPDATFEKIDQLVVEFHEVDDPKYVDVIEKLKKFFYIVNVHFNNNGCRWWSKPFPSFVYEVLMVNKRLAVLDTTNPEAVHPNPLDATNTPSRSDCQDVVW
jgi:hypothetical protein